MSGCESAKKDDLRKEETTDEKESTKKEEKKLQAKRGTVDYRNESFGVFFPISDQIKVCTNEQFVDREIYAVDKRERILNDITINFSDNISSLSVVYENMDQSQETFVDEEQYAKETGNELPAIQFVNCKVGDIDGTEFTSMTVSTDQFTQKFLLHRVASYMIEFIFTYTPDTEQEINDFISSITYENPQ